MRIVLFSTLAFLVALSSVGRGRTNQEQLSTERVLSRCLPSVSPLPQSAPAAFRSIMTASGTPGGEATIIKGGPKPRALVRVRGDTLGEALRSIALGDPSYHWKLTAGVVNLLPKAGVPPLLKTRLASFDSGGTTDGASAVAQLFALREVNQAANRLGLTHAVETSGLGSLGPGGAPLAKQPLRIRLSHPTVIEVLNAIVRRVGRGVWQYTESRCGGSLSFQVAFSQ